MKVSEKFYSIAVEFCNWMENPTPFHDNETLDLIKLIIRLYQNAMCLEDVYNENDVHVNEEIDYCNLISNKLINFIFYEEQKAILNDDLMDLYKDLKCNLILYEKNEKNEAIWQWKFLFFQHWGLHAISAVNILHLYLVEKT